MTSLGRGQDLSGLRFNKLTVTEPVGRTSNGTIRWSCVCDCGNTTTVSSASLRNNGVKSCGCLRIEFATNDRTHGMTKTPTYYSWKSMWARCTNPKSPDYKYYGGRGIGVCARWKSFEAFFEDMGVRPSDRTLDRERVNEDYGPDNCRWATAKEQANNRRKK